MAAPTDSHQLFHYNMFHGNLFTQDLLLLPFIFTLAHGVFKRGYEIILPLLDDPPKDDLHNFLGYCEAWAASIESHHEAEVRQLFS
jgi:hypothetical protein